MEQCIDHPKNIAVESCKECARYICGLHENGYCVDHGKALESQVPGKFIVIFFMIFVGTIFAILGSFLASLINTFNEVDGVSNGDVVTVDGEVITITDTSVLPDASTLLFAFLSFAIPILIIISVVLIRLSRAAREPTIRIRTDPQFEKPVMKISEKLDKTFFCQKCGSNLRMSDDSCPSCGKDISDEKNLVS